MVLNFIFPSGNPTESLAAFVAVFAAFVITSVTIFSAANTNPSEMRS